MNLIKHSTLAVLISLMVACHTLPSNSPPGSAGASITLLSDSPLPGGSIGTMTSRGLQLNLEAVLFEVDKAILRREGFRKIDELVKVIQQDTSHLVYIEGHTDDTGEASYNQQLSEKRAQTVKDALVAKGVMANRLIAKGYGQTRPIASNKSKDGRQKNRRVEILISKEGIGNKSLVNQDANSCSYHPYLSWKNCGSPPVDRF